MSISPALKIRGDWDCPVIKDSIKAAISVSGMTTKSIFTPLTAEILNACDREYVPGAINPLPKTKPAVADNIMQNISKVPCSQMVSIVNVKYPEP